MKDPATRTRRNYRRRICSQSSTGDDDDDNDDDEKDNDLGCDSSAGVEVLKLQPHSAPSGAEKNLIAAAVVDEIVADSRGQSGEEDGLFVSSPGGGASVDATVTHTAKREDGSGQNGARIAGGIGFHMLRAMGWAENTGLGQLGKGMVDPFLPTVKEGNLGLGFNAPSEYDTQQEAIRQVQKAKREERDRKLKVKEGAKKVHGVNSNVLLFMSGLSYASDLTFLLEDPMVFRNQSLRNKLVYEVHWYSWSSGGDYSTSNLNSICASDVDRFVHSTGFLIKPNQEYTSPLVVSEFGFSMDGKHPGDNHFMDCYFSLASELDLDWVLWALQGSYYRRDGQPDYEEVYGLLTRTWDGIRNATFLQRLRGLQHQLPGPLGDHGIRYRSLFHPATGLCVIPSSNSSLHLNSCHSGASVWSYEASDGLMVKLKGSGFVVIATANGIPAELGNRDSCSGCRWTLAGDRELQFSVDIGGKRLCLDGKAAFAVTTVDCLCLNRWECGGSQVVPSSQWFQFIEA